MCKISKEIKLCSCATNLESIDNMWVLKTNLARPQILFGEYYHLGLSRKKQDVKNRELLLDKLNSKNLFDFEYTPCENDQLEITICVDEGGGKFLKFKFYYSDGRWTDKKIPFMNEEIKITNGGYIKNGI